jgi:hypothetical protein
MVRTRQYHSLAFGWEFTHILEARVVEKDHEMHARFQRYKRFGMRWEEARLPTPEHLQKAYNKLVDAIANDRTPSPSLDALVVDTARPIRKSKKGFPHSPTHSFDIRETHS